MKYFFRSDTKHRAHIWTGIDTVCRMWSTNGLRGNKKLYVVADSPEGRQICYMCKQNFSHTNRNRK